jgi:hypothetical protein
VDGIKFAEILAMKRHLAYVLAVAAALSAAVGWAVLRDANTGVSMTAAARAFLATLSDEQQATVALPADSPLRFDWHFIPKDQRKGLQIKHMNEARRAGFVAQCVKPSRLRQGDENHVPGRYPARTGKRAQRRSDP